MIDLFIKKTESAQRDGFIKDSKSKFSNLTEKTSLQKDFNYYLNKKADIENKKKQFHKNEKLEKNKSDENKLKQSDSSVSDNFNQNNNLIQNQINTEFNTQGNSEFEGSTHSHVNSQFDSDFERNMNSNVSIKVKSETKSENNIPLLSSDQETDSIDNLEMDLFTQLNDQISSKIDSQIDSKVSNEIDPQLNSEFENNVSDLSFQFNRPEILDAEELQNKIKNLLIKEQNNTASILNEDLMFSEGIQNSDVRSSELESKLMTNLDLNEDLNDNFLDQKESILENQLEENKSESNHFGQSEFQFNQDSSASVKSNGQNIDVNSDFSISQLSENEKNNLESNKSDLINKALYLSNRGGGEISMNISTQDGLKDLHLKVSLSMGQVNIELNTLDQSVKKIIEENLEDLRTSFGSKQINLDQIKINNIEATSAENQQFDRDSKQNKNKQSQNESFKNFSNQQNSFFDQNKKNKNTIYQNLNSDLITNISSNINSNSLTQNKNPVSQTTTVSKYYGSQKANSVNTIA